MVNNNVISGDKETNNWVLEESCDQGGDLGAKPSSERSIVWRSVGLKALGPNPALVTESLCNLGTFLWA